MGNAAHFEKEGATYTLRDNQTLFSALEMLLMDKQRQDKNERVFKKAGETEGSRGDCQSNLKRLVSLFYNLQFSFYIY